MWPKAIHKHLSAEGAMMIKYMCNVFFASKVSIFNEFFKLYQFIGDDWDKIIDTIQHQKWVGNQHIYVPGPDCKFGYGGKCFPKDISALIKMSEKFGTVNNIMKSTVETNNVVRN
jgi:UDPglucose 6-dehydrogenase